MKSIYKFFFVAFFANFATPVRALVDVKDLSLALSHTDLRAAHFEMSRHYHSGRKTVGLFGQGWCSVWETKLVPAKDKLNFIYCGAGNRIPFEASGRGWHAPIAGYTATPGRDGQVTVEQYQKNSFTFNRAGQLVEYKTPDDRYVVSYAGERLAGIATKASRVAFKYAAGELQEIEVAGQGRRFYTWKNHQLIGVGLADSKTGKTRALYQYQYGGGLQITRVLESGKETRVTYDRGVVQSVAARGCNESLTRSTAGPRVVVVAERHCGQFKSAKTFTLQGRSRLSQLSVATSQTGQPVETDKWRAGQLVSRSLASTKGTTEVTFKYDRNGLVSEIKSPLDQTRVTGRQFGRATRLSIQEAKSQREVRLAWSGSALSGFSQSGRDVRLKPLPDGYEIFARDLHARVQRLNGGVQLSGNLGGKMIPPFAYLGKLGLLRPEQFSLVAAVNSVDEFKSFAERL